MKDVAGLEIGTYDEEDEDHKDWTFRKEFDDTKQQNMAETFKRSLTAWHVAETSLEEDPSIFGAQSFGLIALGKVLVRTRAE